MIRVGGHKTKNKYHAVQTEYRGIRYASRSEAGRAEVLDLLLRSGDVRWWLRQVPIYIGEPGVDRPFRVDFLVCEKCGLVHAEDVKGVETWSFRRHVKQWLNRGPFPLHVIYSDRTEIVHGK